MIPGDSAGLSGRGAVFDFATLAPLLLLVFGLSQTPAIAQDHEILGQTALPPSPIFVNLDSATVTVVLNPDKDQTIRWWRARPEEHGSDALLVNKSTDGVRIERENDREGDDLAEIVVEISTTPGHLLWFGGSSLDLTVTRENDETEEGEEEKEEEFPEGDIDDVKVAPIPVQPTTIEFELSESVVSINGTGAVAGFGRNCAVSLKETTGDHSLDLTSSEAHITTHRGLTNLTAHNTSFTVEGMSGSFIATTTGGSIDLESSSGKFRIDQQDGQIQVFDFRGGGSINTSNSNIDLRDSRMSALSIRGEESYVTASNHSGAVTLNLSGGFFSISDSHCTLSGRALNGADIEVTDHVGNATLALKDGATGEFFGIRGTANLDSTNATTTLAGVQALAFKAENSIASFAGIKKLISFHVTSSEVDLDLSDLTARGPKVTVQSESLVSVRLASPCRVQAPSASDKLANSIDVTGCELKLGRKGRWATRNARGIDGRSPTLLIAQVAESATLIVESNP